jgi:hypothetical protein
MGGEACSFSIGTIHCTPVSDGSCPFPPSVFFADVPQEELRAHSLRTDELTLVRLLAF